MYTQALPRNRSPATPSRQESAFRHGSACCWQRPCGLIARQHTTTPSPSSARSARRFQLSPRAAGLIATMAQVGYGVGLLLVVPLCDLVENRRLVFLILCVAVLALLGAAVSTSAAAFLAAAALIGLGSVAVQILVPYAAHVAPDASRGRVVGNVMSGLMLGIMLARPAASLVTEALSWRAVFVISSAPHGRPGCRAAGGVAAAPACAGLGLWQPVGIDGAAGPPYADPAAPGTLPGVPVRGVQPVLDSGAAATGQPLPPVPRTASRCLPWSGVTGAIAAPLAGRMADRGWSKPVTGLAMSSVGAALLLGLLGSFGIRPWPTHPGGHGDSTRFRRSRKRGAWPACDLRAGRRSPRPAQRPLHGDLLRRGRHRVSPGRVELCGRWLATDHGDRAAAAGGSPWPIS